MSTPKHQVRYQLVKQPQGYALQRRDAEPVRAPSDGEVLVRVRACSLNRRERDGQKRFLSDRRKGNLRASCRMARAKWWRSVAA
jgi:hypothetical protein